MLCQRVVGQGKQKNYYRFINNNRKNNEAPGAVRIIGRAEQERAGSQG
jgi:hypothetical protein